MPLLLPTSLYLLPPACPQFQHQPSFTLHPCYPSCVHTCGFLDSTLSALPLLLDSTNTTLHVYPFCLWIRIVGISLLRIHIFPIICGFLAGHSGSCLHCQHNGGDNKMIKASLDDRVSSRPVCVGGQDHVPVYTCTCVSMCTYIHVPCGLSRCVLNFMTLLPSRSPGTW